MTDTLAAHLPHTDGTVVEYCQSLPGFLLAPGRFDEARMVMSTFADAAGEGYLPAAWSSPGRRKKTPDVHASLWFIQAGYSYFTYTRDETTWRNTLLPRMKKIGQGLISGAFPHVRMGDGGLLELSPTGGSVRGKRTRAADMSLAETGLVLNILWDNALAILAEELQRAGDHAGDHFSRLGGRFKRSFLKMYWSDIAGCLVVPAPTTPGKDGADVKTGAGEAHREPDAAPTPAPGSLTPDSHQLLAAVLPYSAVPRTKQRQIVDLIRQRGYGPFGVRIDHAGENKHDKHAGHPLYSPLHLAWLAEGHVRTSDTPATAVAEAQSFLRLLHGLMEGGSSAIAKLYDDHGPAKGKANPPAHGPTMAEVSRVWLGLQAAAERPIGNSKRTRITGTLMPGGVTK